MTSSPRLTITRARAGIWTVLPIPGRYQHALHCCLPCQCLRLIHFHIGSQVPNIITIKNAVIEAARFYCQLAKMGFPMGYLDVGGGLGIDALHVALLRDRTPV